MTHSWASLLLALVSSFGRRNWALIRFAWRALAADVTQLAFASLWCMKDDSSTTFCIQFHRFAPKLLHWLR